jgi:hypothetical protein
MAVFDLRATHDDRRRLGTCAQACGRSTSGSDTIKYASSPTAAMRAVVGVERVKMFEGGV